MSDVLIFNLARRLKRRWSREGMAALSQAEVDEINAVLDDWRKAQNAPVAAQDGAGAQAGGTVAPTGLRDAGAFYEAVRGSFGALDQSQVDGFNRLLAAMGAAGWPIAWAAYGLATAWHETNKQMQPVEEGYYLGPEWAKRHQRGLRYFPWYGRGDVQLTWEDNYRKADKELGLGGSLVANPERALEPAISAKILVWGMGGGKYTGKGLADYLPRDGKADHRQFKLARYVVNVQDRADEIAAKALKIQDGLEAGGWA